MELAIFLIALVGICFVFAAIVPAASYIRKARASRRQQRTTVYEYRFSRDLFDAEYPTSMGMMASNAAIEEQFRQSLESDGSEYRI